jgi:hypothetical protein
MKPFAVFLILVFAVAIAGAAIAQDEPLAMVRGEGKGFQSAVLDTLHSSLVQKTGVGGVSAAKWRGPMTIYKPKDNGDFSTSRAMPNRWEVVARKPFWLKVIYANGDSSGLKHTLIDTTAAARAGTLVAWTDVFACRTIISGPVSQIRTVPTSGDTVYIYPKAVAVE